MSAELDSIIGSAMDTIDSGGSDGGDTGDTGGFDAGDSGTDPADLSTADSTDAGTDAGTDGAEAVASGQPADAGAADGRTAEDLAFDAELAELGLSAPKPGQRDNRIPYSRIRKIVANAKTKWSEKLKGEHTTELSAREAQIKELNDLKATYDRAEQAIQSDGDNYIAYLARTFPNQYGKYVKGVAAADPKAALPQKPQPDLKYDDGTVGYSPEQWERREEFNRQEAVREAREALTKEFTERFGPIEQRFKAEERTQQDIQRVRGHIDGLRNQWGADLIDNPAVQKEIVAHLDANKGVTLVEAARVVAMKRIGADRNAIRADLLKELQAAPAAAAKTPVAPNRSGAANDAASIDDIIRASMRNIR